MKLPTRKQVADLSERTAWTLLQAGAGEGIVQLFDLPQPYAVAIAGGLALLKGSLAQKFSQTGSAATLPVSVDPAAEPVPVEGPPGRHEAPDQA